MDTWRPLVSVVLPVLNEERHIRDALDSVCAQDYPHDLIEVIVADAGSSDETQQIVATYAAADPRFRLIVVPGLPAIGLNRAIALSRGEVIARLDGHAAWSPSHVRRCVGLLDLTGAVNVGGTMANVGETPVGEALALATASRFGVGGARYRYAERQIETDTVWLGCFRKSAILDVGGFDEALDGHEDYEINARLRARGGKIVFSPELPTTYWTRSSWRSIARLFFTYGRRKALTAATNPDVMQPYHLVPAVFAATAPVMLAGAISGHGRRLALIGLGTYATACVVAGTRTGQKTRLDVRLRVPVLFPVLHLTWGTGFWVGLLQGRLRRHD